MESASSAALTSWTLDWRLICLLLVAATLYVRGWLRIRKQVREESDGRRLACYCGGLLLLFLATESPLDTFDNLFVSAHMTQHILLMMFAPPLILLGRPFLPLLRALPKTFVREALGPFLVSRELRRAFLWITAPPVAWLAFASSTIFWHVPKFYEMALSNPAWHGVQHASFFWSGVLFWWPLIEPGPRQKRWPEWMAIPYLLFADILNTVIAAFFVFSGTLLYPSYASVHASSASPLEDQALAGLIMWVPGSLVFLIPAFVLAARLLSSPRLRRQPKIWRVTPTAPRPPFGLSHLMPRARRVAQAGMLLLAIAVMADGLGGPQVAPLNLAGTLPWIYWRALAILALLVAGNLFCMVCPFIFVRDLARIFLPAKVRWPRALRNKWMAAAFFVLFLWAYEAFGLWSSPWLTAWIIAGYFLTAVLIDGFFRGASFCKYVCPIGQFHFVSGLLSPREVAVRSPAVCRSCKTYDCIKGNAQARGCELDLFQPKKASNLDCTFCLDCVKACPHENVALTAVAPAKTLLSDPYRSSLGRLSKRTDWAVLVLIVVFGAFVNAAGMLTPITAWEHRWHARLGTHAVPLIVAAFVIAGVFLAPAAAIALCGAFARLAKPRGKNGDVMRRLIFALTPLGVTMWAAHFAYHAVTGWKAAGPAIQRLLEQSNITPAAVAVPDWLVPGQILLLNAGLLLALYLLWHAALELTTRTAQAVALAVPWGVLSCLLYSAGIWILMQPMELRGMLM